MMQPTRVLCVPTGKIAIATGDTGRELECLFVADYGKDANLKADFLGLTDEVHEVLHQDCMPLEEKIVVTISTQYGCSMGCHFCDVPKVGKGVNVTVSDLTEQVRMMVAMSEVQTGKRLNIHFARMGEPSLNKHVLTAARMFKDLYSDKFATVHPVVSTMLPKKNKELLPFLCDWMEIKNSLYNGEAGLQLSINSTNDAERQTMFNGSSITFDEAGEIGLHLSEHTELVGRKITLNFALANYEIDPLKLLTYFDPARYVIKLTPMHITDAVTDNEVKFVQDYRPVEAALKAAGYDVIVFVPSHEEDASRITCGNAILSGTRPEVTHSEYSIPDNTADWIKIVNL